MIKILLIFILILASGCSQQRLAFQFADSAASWTADDYFDLSSAQKDQVKKQLRVFFKKTYEWNDQQLPKAFEKAEQILARLEDKNSLQCQDAAQVRDQILIVAGQVGQIASEEIQSLLKSLTERQIQFFVLQLADKIDEDEKKLKDPKRQIERRIDNAVEQAENFLGSLTNQQENQIENHILALPTIANEQLKSRKTNFEKLKVSALSKETFEKFVLDYLQNWTTFQSESYLKILNQIQKSNEEFYTKLVCEASSKQLKYLHKKIVQIQRDFEDIFIRN